MNAQSPFNRMGQHLGFAKNSCMLRTWLEKRGIRPERCSFRLVAYGPVLREISNRVAYRRRRDKVAAIERELQKAMERVGYDVLNEVKCKKRLPEALYQRVLRSFAAEFARLRDA